MLFCQYLKILNFSTKDPVFSFCTWPCKLCKLTFWGRRALKGENCFLLALAKSWQLARMTPPGSILFSPKDNSYSGFKETCTPLQDPVSLLYFRKTFFSAPHNLFSYIHSCLVSDYISKLSSMYLFDFIWMWTIEMWINVFPISKIMPQRQRWREWTLYPSSRLDGLWPY